MERRLDEAPSRFVSVHGARGCGDQCRALIMFVENQEKTPSRVAVVLTKVIEPLDCLDQHALVELVWIMVDRGRGLLDPDVEDKATEFLDLVEQPIRGMAKLRVLGYVGNGEEAGALLLPRGRMLT